MKNEAVEFVVMLLAFMAIIGIPTFLLLYLLASGV
jgi:hypothetical protein